MCITVSLFSIVFCHAIRLVFEKHGIHNVADNDMEKIQMERRSQWEQRQIRKQQTLEEEKNIQVEGEKSDNGAQMGGENDAEVEGERRISTPTSNPVSEMLIE